MYFTLFGSFDMPHPGRSSCSRSRAVELYMAGSNCREQPALDYARGCLLVSHLVMPSQIFSPHIAKTLDAESNMGASYLAAAGLDFIHAFLRRVLTDACAAPMCDRGGHDDGRCRNRCSTQPAFGLHPGRNTDRSGRSGARSHGISIDIRASPCGARAVAGLAAR